MAKLILVCDDDADLRRALALLLTEFAEVALAADGEQALALIAARRPDLVFLDMNMPGLSGLETLRRLHEILPNLPVVLLTGRRQIGLARRALAAGARSFITKPFELEDIKAEVQRAFGVRGAEPDGRPWRVVS